MDIKHLYWLGEEPEFDESEISETYETDVIVCGAGIAGVPAARAAVEAGAECILFEKCSQPQARSGQFGVIGGEFLKNWGIDNADKAGEIVNCLMRDGCYRPKQRILERFAKDIGKDFDWYLEGLDRENLFISNYSSDVPPDGTKMHVMLMQYPVSDKYDLYDERYPTYPYTIQIRPGHIFVLKENLKIAEKTGLLKTFFKTPVKKLLRDAESGRVNGVIAKDYDGKVIRAYARRGVVLATGDYAGDQDMLEYYCPGVADNPKMSCGIDPEKKPNNTGDGHRMGLWIGAKMETGPHAMNAHNMGGAMGVTPYLQLDVDGRRFMNEDCPGQQVENQLSMLRDRISWQFFDSNWREQVPYMPLGHGCCSHVVDDEAVAEGTYFDGLGPMDGYASQTYIDKSIERGGTFKAETLEELVELTGLPKETALASIARYNELARKGVDEDFGKVSRRLFPIESAPFYASRLTAAPLLCCHGGLESDEEAHCYDENMNVIPGLYVAGNVQGNRVAVEYPTTLPGFSHSIALVFGRVAGYNAAMGI